MLKGVDKVYLTNCTKMKHRLNFLLSKRTAVTIIRVFAFALIFAIALVPNSCTSKIHEVKIYENCYFPIKEKFNSIVNSSFASDTSKMLTPFQYYCDYIASAPDNDSIYYSHFFDRFEVSQLKLIYNELHDMTCFSDIWKEESYYCTSRNCMVKELVYNEKGAYFNFLKKVDKKYFKEKESYFEAIVSCGGGNIPMTHYSGYRNLFFYVYDNDNDIQVISAIHYFTLIFNFMEREGY